MTISKKDSDTVRTNHDRFCYMRDNGHLKYLDKANLCDDYFEGKQWDTVLERRLQSQGKPVLTINKTLATLAAVMGEQLKNRADIAFKPMSGGKSEIAATLDKVYLQIANANKLDWMESNVADNGFITSRGFYDVRVGFNDHMQGEVDITSLNPRNVMIDPDAEEYDPRTWKDVIITKWLTLDDIEMTYGKAKADRIKAGGSPLAYDYDTVERSHQTFGGFLIPPSNESHSKDESNTLRKYRVIERQHRVMRWRWHFVAETGEIKPVPEDWEEAQIKRVAKATDTEIIRKRVEQIRWTVTCYNTVLFDDWSPYKYFTVVPYFPFFRAGRTVGIVENLISSQDLLNKTASQELHIVNTTANSGWKVKSGSLHNMTIEQLEERGAETGLVLELDDIGNIDKISPNTVPTGLDRISFKADQFIKEISGVSDSARGFDRADVAAKAIQAKQAAGSVNLAKPLDNLARTRHMLAIRILDLVQKFYTEKRVLQITGNRLDAQTEDVTINSGEDDDVTVGRYDVVVTSVPARNTFQESQFQEAVQLKELGLQIPDTVLIQNSSLENKQEIIEGFSPSEEEQQMEQQARQLELQEKQVEIAEKQTKAILNRANAMLAMARAKQIGAQAEKIGQDMMLDANANGTPDVNPVQMLQYKLQREESIERREMERERLELDKQKNQDDNVIKIRQMLEQRAAARQQAKGA